MKIGQYYKLVGGHGGVVWVEKSWVRFDCEVCIRQLGIGKERLQGPMSSKAGEALKGPVIYRHDIPTHNKYMGW